MNYFIYFADILNDLNLIEKNYNKLKDKEANLKAYCAKFELKCTQIPDFQLKKVRSTLFKIKIHKHIFLFIIYVTTSYHLNIIFYKLNVYGYIV